MLLHPWQHVFWAGTISWIAASSIKAKLQEGSKTLSIGNINSYLACENLFPPVGWLEYKDDHGNTPLLLAVRACHYELVQRLVKAGANVNAQNKLGKTPIMYAIECEINDLEISKELLQVPNIDINIRDMHNRTFVSYLARGFVEKSTIWRLILERNVDLTKSNKKNRNALIMLIAYKKFKLAQILVEQVESNPKQFQLKIDANSQLCGRSILSVAITRGCASVEFVQALIRLGVDINAKDHHGFTALNYALRRKKYQIMKILLENQALLVDKRSTQRFLLKIIYDKTEHFELAKMLVERVGLEKLHTSSEEWKDELICAMQRNHFNIFSYLLQVYKDLVYEKYYRFLINRAIPNEIRYIALILEKFPQYELDFQFNDGTTPLILAIENDNFDLVKLLLQARASENYEANCGSTPLLVAAQENCSIILNYLLTKNVAIDKKNNIGETALSLACRNEDITNAKTLLAHGANPMIASEENDTPLIYASMHSSELVQEIIDQIVKVQGNIAAAVNAKNSYKNTALMFASIEGQIEIVETLINKRASIKSKDKNQQMAMHKAASNGHLQVIKLLLANGASKSPIDRFGATPLLYSCEGNLETFNFLLETADPAELELVIKDGMTALMLAANSSNLDIAKSLISNSADPLTSNMHSELALHFACDSGNAEVIDYLLTMAPETINYTSNLGTTPLMRAVGSNKLEAIQCLLKRGANINLADETRCTALHYACRQKNFLIAQELVQHGASTSAKDGIGNTPLAIAHASKCVKVFRYLYQDLGELTGLDDLEEKLGEGVGKVLIYPPSFKRLPYKHRRLIVKHFNFRKKLREMDTTLVAKKLVKVLDKYFSKVQAQLVESVGKRSKFLFWKTFFKILANYAREMVAKVEDQVDNDDLLKKESEVDQSPESHIRTMAEIIIGYDHIHGYEIAKLDRIATEFIGNDMLHRRYLTEQQKKYRYVSRLLKQYPFTKEEYLKYDAFGTIEVISGTFKPLIERGTKHGDSIEAGSACLSVKHSTE